jgi:hypothetical protein
MIMGFCALHAGGGDHPVTVHAKMHRLELLKVNADLECELETWSLNCTKCGLDVLWSAVSASLRGTGAIGSARRTASPRCSSLTIPGGGDQPERRAQNFHPGPLVTRLRDAVGLVVSPEVIFDLLDVFTLGGLLVGQLRPVASKLAHASRLRLGAWSPSPHRPLAFLACQTCPDPRRGS